MNFRLINRAIEGNMAQDEEVCRRHQKLPTTRNYATATIIDADWPA